MTDRFADKGHYVLRGINRESAGRYFRRTENPPRPPPGCNAASINDRGCASLRGTRHRPLVVIRRALLSISSRCDASSDALRITRNDTIERGKAPRATATAVRVTRDELSVANNRGANLSRPPRRRRRPRMEPSWT